MPLLEGEDSWYEWFEQRSPAEKKQLGDIAAMLPRVGPVEGPQLQAYNSPAQILGYGGSAGGGKSALIALLVLLAHQRSVIFRFDAKQMSGLVDDIVDFYGTNEGLNRQRGVFYFGDFPGHMCEWGGLGKPGSEMQWRGRPHDFLAVDEATEMPLPKLIFLQTWLRTVRRGQRTRVLYTFNPPGLPDEVTGEVPPGRWVLEFFAPWINERHPFPAEPGEIRYFLSNAKGESEEVETDEPREITFKNGKTELLIPRSRTFIPANVDDNPYQTADYKQNLLSLDEGTREQMYFGSFKQSISDSPYQTLPTKWVDAAMDRWTPEGERELMTALGVDVARGGRAFTVFAPRHGLWFNKVTRVQGSETPQGGPVARIAAGIVRDGAKINVDANGVGAAAFDAMDGANMRAVAVQVAARKGLRLLPGKERIYNKRTWLYWLMRALLNPENGFHVCLPRDDRLRSDLITPHFRDVEGGQKLVESKEDVRKRLRRSTDDGDAVLLALDNFFDEAISEKLNVRYGGPRPTVIRPRAYRGREQNQWMLM